VQEAAIASRRALMSPTKEPSSRTLMSPTKERSSRSLGGRELGGGGVPDDAAAAPPQTLGAPPKRPSPRPPRPHAEDAKKDIDDESRFAFEGYYDGDGRASCRQMLYGMVDIPSSGSGALDDPLGDDDLLDNDAADGLSSSSRNKPDARHRPPSRWWPWRLLARLGLGGGGGGGSKVAIAGGGSEKARGGGDGGEERGAVGGGWCLGSYFGSDGGFWGAQPRVKQFYNSFVIQIGVAVRCRGSLLPLVPRRGGRHHLPPADGDASISDVKDE
jgi:hypothetical protein